MSDWNRICCAVDASAPSRSALEHAVELALRSSAALHVLHVSPAARRFGVAPFAPPPRPVHGDAGPADELSRWIAAAQERLPRLVYLERNGDAADGILAYAREWDCDVLVLGTHGRSGVQRLLLGSVAEEVVRAAPCAVLVVPAGEGADRRRGRGRPEPPHGSAPPAGNEPSGTT